MHRAVLGVALAFTAIFGFLTFFVLLTSGPDLLVIISLLVLAIIGFGILGALAQTPPDR